MRQTFTQHNTEQKVKHCVSDYSWPKAAGPSDPGRQHKTQNSRSSHTGRTLIAVKKPEDERSGQGGEQIGADPRQHYRRKEAPEDDLFAEASHQRQEGENRLFFSGHRHQSPNQRRLSDSQYPKAPDHS